MTPTIHKLINLINKIQLKQKAKNTKIKVTPIVHNLINLIKKKNKKTCPTQHPTKFNKFNKLNKQTKTQKNKTYYNYNYN